MSLYNNLLINKKLSRPHVYTPITGYGEGTMGSKMIHVCICDSVKRRGHIGGCCGNCGGAIPTVEELKSLTS